MPSRLAESFEHPSAKAGPVLGGLLLSVPASRGQRQLPRNPSHFENCTCEAKLSQQRFLQLLVAGVRSFYVHI